MSIRTIPIEIKTLIYNLLLPKDIVAARLTCKEWRTEIDNLMASRWQQIQMHFGFIQQHEPSARLVDIAPWIEVPHSPENLVKLSKLFSLILGIQSLPLLVESSCLYFSAEKLKVLHSLGLDIICATNADATTEEKRRKLLISPENHEQPDKVTLYIHKPDMQLAIPHELANLRNLTELDFHGNLAFLPINIGALTNLVELNLSNNHLSCLPNSFGNLSKIKFLYLNQNDFDSFPTIVLKLGKLKALHIDFNQLTSLPDDLSQLNNLRGLNISNNRISLISNVSIENLKGLVDLYINENQLSTLPEALGSLPQLAVFEAENNPLSFIPEEILKSDRAAFTESTIIQNYKRQLESSALGKL